VFAVLPAYRLRQPGSFPMHWTVIAFGALPAFVSPAANYAHGAVFRKIAEEIS
jgi:hypothetical protein